MDKRAGKKSQFARRVTALLLSLAMVISVLYLNDRNRVSEADPLDGTQAVAPFWDDDYISDLITAQGIDITAEWTADIQIHVPTDQVTFTLPAAPSDDTGVYTYGWFTDADAPTAKAAPEDWNLNVGTPVTEIAGTTRVQLYKYKLGTQEDTTDPENPIAATPCEIVKMAGIQLTVTGPVALATTLDKPNKKVLITDTDPYSSGDGNNVFYYATASYAFVKGNDPAKIDPADVTGWNTKESINTKINEKTGAAGDGKYTIYKKVELLNGVEGTPAVCYFKSEEQTKDFYWHVTDAHIDAGSLPGLYDESEKRFSIEGVDPMQDVAISVTTDKPLSKMELKEGSTTVQSTTASPLTIPGASANQGQTKSYKLYLTSDSEDRPVLEYSVSVSYLSTKPTISDLRVVANSTRKDKSCYINEQELATTKIRARVRTKAPVVLQKAELRLVDPKTGKADEPVGKPLTIGKSDATVEFPFEPKSPGLVEYKVWAKSSNTIDGEAFSGDSVKIFYDPTAPTIKNLGVVQGSTTYPVQSGTLSEKLTVTKDLKIQAKIEDATNGSNESGMASVKAKVNGNAATVTEASGTYSISLDKDYLQKFIGRDLPVSIIAKDKAGNTKQYDLTISFYNEIVTVSSRIRNMKDRVTDKNKIYTSNSSFDIVYTIESDVKISELELKMTQDDGSETKETIPASKLKGGTLTKGTYTYTYTKSISKNVSTALKKITLNAKNEHGKWAESADVITFIGIDLTPAGYTYSSAENQEYVENGIWRRKMVLNIKFTDPDADDPSGGKFQTGFSKTQADTLKDVKGATVTEFVVDDDGKSGHVILDVLPSTSLAGTKVSFSIYDKVGHKMPYAATVYIDKESPEVNHLTVNGTESPTKYAGDPVITAKSSDNIKVSDATLMIRKPDGTVVNASEFLKAGSLAETSLSKLLGGRDQMIDGTYKIVLKAADLPINSVTSPQIDEVPAEKSVSFIVDNSAPVVSAEIRNEKDVIVNGKYTSEDYITVLLDAEDYNLSSKNIIVRLDGMDQSVDWSTDDTGYKTTGSLIVSGEGKHTVRIMATDDAGNKAQAKAVSFIIDNTAPEISTQLDEQDYDPGDLWYRNKAAAITLYVDDENKDVANGIVTTVKLRPNDGGMTTTDVYENVKEGTVKYSEDGYYVITYEVTDLAENTATRTIRFVVDAERPTNDILLQEPENAEKFAKYQTKYENPDTGEEYAYANYFNHNVAMDFLVEDAYLSTITVTDNGVTVLRKKDFTESAGSLTASYSVATEGVHNIVITSMDKSENVSKTRTVSFVIDKTSPVLSTTLNGSPFSDGGDMRYLDSNGTVAVTVSDTNKDPDDLTKTQKITPPGQGSQDTVVKVPEGAEGFSQEADYQLSYVAVDKAGNKSSARSVSFRIDKTAPQLQISGTTEGGISTSSVVATYRVIEAFYQDMTSAIVKVYKKIDGSPEHLLRTVDFKATGQDSTMSETFAEDGEYRFEFDAQDRTGNAAHTTYSFLVDATAPTLTLSGVKNYEKTKTDVELGVLVTENFYTSNTITIEGVRQDIDGNKTPVEIQPFNAHSGREVNIKQLFKEDGIYDVNITTKDKAGNESKQSVHFTIDKTKPIIGDLEQYDKKKLSKFEWDVDENALVRDLTVCDVTTYLDGVAYDGLAEVSNGAHVLRIKAVDELKNENTRDYEFSVDAIAPTIIINGVEDKVTVDQPVDVKVALQIGDDVLDQVTLNGESLNQDGNTASFKVDKEGDYKLVVTAHDSANNETKLEWNFSYGMKFDGWWWIIAGAGGAIALLLIILLIRRRSWKKR